MVKLRLKRMGSKKRPVYRVVAIDSQKPRDSKYLDLIGTFDPQKADDNQIKLDSEKVLKWVKNGAVITQAVKTLVKKQGIKIL